MFSNNISSLLSEKALPRTAVVGSDQKSMVYGFFPVSDYQYKTPALIKSLSEWSEYFDANSANQKLSDPDLYNDWNSVIKLIIKHLHSTTQFDCFIIYKGEQISGIALCGWKQVSRWGYLHPTLSYHIFAMLSAPWNILPRCIKEHENKTYQQGVGSALLSAIVHHARVNLKAESIIAVTSHSTPSIGKFLKKRLFDGAGEKYGNYRLSKSKYKTFLKQFVCVAKKVVATESSMRDKYPITFEGNFSHIPGLKEVAIASSSRINFLFTSPKDRGNFTDNQYFEKGWQDDIRNPQGYWLLFSDDDNLAEVIGDPEYIINYLIINFPPIFKDNILGLTLLSTNRFFSKVTNEQEHKQEQTVTNNTVCIYSV